MYGNEVYEEEEQAPEQCKIEDEDYYPETEGEDDINVKEESKTEDDKIQLEVKKSGDVDSLEINEKEVQKLIMISQRIKPAIEFID